MKKAFSVRDITVVGICAAMLAIISQFSIPFPGGVPLTFQCFAVTLLACALGPRRSVLSAVVYILLGCVGLPVFAGFNGGISAVAGATGGFILGFPIMAGITSAAASSRRPALALAGVLAGLLTDYALGVTQLAFVAGLSIPAAFAAGAAPFILKDAALCCAAYFIGVRVRSMTAAVAAR